MKGYRTIIVNMLMALAMGGTIQLSSLPPQVQSTLTVAAMVWAFVAILLRLITTTPVGQKFEAAVEKDLGITPEQMNALLAKLPQQADLNALFTQGEKIVAAVESLNADKHPAPVVAPAAAPVPQH